MPLRKQTQFDWKLAVKWLPAYLAVTFLLYVLAAGPLYWHIWADVMAAEDTTLVRLYLPLLLLCQHSEPVNVVMDWYLRWWV